MLSCRELTEQTTDFLERRLTPWQRVQVRFHLLLCRACRGYLHQSRQVIGMLRGLPKEPPRPEVSAALLAAFRKKRAGPSEP